MTSCAFLYLLSPVHSATATPRPVNPHHHHHHLLLLLILLAPFPLVSKCSPLKRWCPICHTRAKRDHALLFSITEFSSCQLRWDRRRSRWVAVSVINQHEIFSFEYTHHLLLLPPPPHTHRNVHPPLQKKSQGCLGYDLTWSWSLFLNEKLQGRGVLNNTTEGLGWMKLYSTAVVFIMVQ